MDTKTLSANKKIARQSFEANSKGDYDSLEKITDTKKFKMHFPGYKNPLNWNDAVEMGKSFNTAFPDTKVTIENQVAEGDYVVTRVIYQGTNKGEFQGMTASGKKTKTSGLSLQHIVKGKIVEEWDEVDTLGMMHQIGAIPEMEKEEKW
jgi:predicted ester cyclase